MKYKIEAVVFGLLLFLGLPALCYYVISSEDPSKPIEIKRQAPAYPVPEMIAAVDGDCKIYRIKDENGSHYIPVCPASRKY